MKKSGRPAVGGRMIARSCSLQNLEQNNKKLEEDVALMESSLQHHRNRMMQQDLAIRSQISKATGSSHWVSGGKGQLKGYRSHKDLKDKKRYHGRHKVHGKGRPTSIKHVPQQTKDNRESECKTSGLGSCRKLDVLPQDRVNQKHGNNVLNSCTQEPHSDIHADEIHPPFRRRSSGSSHGILCNSSPEQKSCGHKKEGFVRKVSFDLSDEDENCDFMERTATSTGKSTPESLSHDVQGQSFLPMHGSDKSSEVSLELDADRIANLKAKVIAKASANTTPQISQTKVKTKRRLQPKKSTKYPSNRTQQETRKKSVPQKTPQLSATGTELHKVLKFKPKPVRQQLEPDDSVHTYIKWEGYETPDEVDLKSSSHSSSDVFLIEPAMSYSKGDVTTRQTITHDPVVTAWLYSLNLLDPEKYSQIFHAHNMTMEIVQKMTEHQLKVMGVTSFGALRKLLDGIKQLSGGEEQQTNTFKMSAFLKSGKKGSVHLDKIENVIDSEIVADNGPIQTKDNHVVQVENPSIANCETNNAKGQKVKDPLVTGRKAVNPRLLTKGNVEAPKKKAQPLSAGVVNHSLASGVHAATHKQKHKHEQQKRQEKLKSRERDWMAEQHTQRMKDRAERKHREEEEGFVGYDEEETSESTWPQTSQSVSVEMRGLTVPSLGLQPHHGTQSVRAGAAEVSSRLYNHPTKQASLSTNVLHTSSPEQQLHQLESQISGLQAAFSRDQSGTEVKLGKIHQQLASLQQQLRPKSGIHMPKGGDNMVTVRKRAVSALTGKRHTRTKSLSKQDLLQEVRKQKEKHRKEIRWLESELSRLRYRDPVRGCELPEEDIVFDETALLGEGAFSQVFSGSFNGSEVAIKRLKIPLKEADHNYFAEEVSLLHELRHPRVVLLLGVCTTRKLPLMVFECMAGGSLYDFLHDVSRSALDHVGYFQIARDICLGMNYLHRHRPVVLHLDLKSMNVLLGTYGRAKIADFGFSKLRHEVGRGKVKGTPAWMAPELLENSVELTTKVDVYSFAIILWEMLTRNTPYKGLSVFHILDRVQNKKRLDIPASCPEHLRRLLCACWEHKPNKRPSFKDILIRLESLSFPPEWKALLSAAGIPRETMENPTSARSIISLVNRSMHLSERQLHKMALKSHEELVKASQIDVVEEKIGGYGDRTGVVDSREQVLDRKECTASIPHVGMEDSGYDDDTLLLHHSAGAVPSLDRSNDVQSMELLDVRKYTSCRIPVAPPPPPLPPTITAPTTNLIPSEILVQASSLHKTAFKTKQTNTLHSPVRDYPQLLLDGNMLSDQRERLRHTTQGSHPSQLADLGQATEARLLCVADILKKAVNSRRISMKENLHSKELQPDSVWSMDSPR